MSLHRLQPPSLWPRTAGPKARRLSWLARHADHLGVQVPDMALLPFNLVDKWLSDALPDQGDSRQHYQTVVAANELDLCDRWHSAFLDTPPPPDVVAALEELTNRVDPQHRFAVRSSCALEDGTNHSFAGLFVSQLNVSSADLVDATRQVVAGLLSPKVVSYAHHAGVAAPAMSVFYQDMLAAPGWRYGVCQTRSSDHPSVHLMAISAGLQPSAGTSHAQIPEQYLLHRELLSKGRYCLLQADAGTDTLQERFLFDETLIMSIAAKCLKIEGLARSPVEIEWALSPDGQIHTLQIRPLCKAFETHQPLPSPRREPLITGTGIGHGTFTGSILHLKSSFNPKQVKDSDVVVFDRTNDEFDRHLMRCGASITATGGRTSHVARLSRELGKLSVAACGDRIEDFTDGEIVTLVCADGLDGSVYRGVVDPVGRQRRTGPVTVNSPSEAFSLVHSSDPSQVFFNLDRLTRAMRIPVDRIDSDTALSESLSHRIVGHPTPEDYVLAKYRHALSMVCTAFPEAHVVTPSLGSPYADLQQKACRQLRELFDFQVSSTFDTESDTVPAT